MDDILALIGRAHQGDKSARDILTEKNMGLVHSIARRFQNRGAELEDLVQIGCIGLLKAIDKFDLSYEVRFSTYAVPMITGEIKRFLRDDGMVKVSRSLKRGSGKGLCSQGRIADENGAGAVYGGNCKGIVCIRRRTDYGDGVFGTGGVLAEDHLSKRWQRYCFGG